MTQRPPRPTRLLLATLASAGLVLGAAACSEDPTATPETTTAPAETTTVPEGGTETTVDTRPYVSPIVDVIGEALTAHVFTALAGYLVETDLVQPLRGEGPFTVFAPPDEAFDAIPLDTLRSVRADKELLTTVLTFHVVPGRYSAADLEPGTYPTLAGIDLEVTKEGDTLFVNGVEVIAADVEASNGVIHVVGGVLLPPTDG